jgi:hypothetical protein
MFLSNFLGTRRSMHPAQSAMNARIGVIAMCLATAAAVAAYVTIETLRGMFFPSVTYSIPWGWIWHVLASITPHFIVHVIIGGVLSWQLYPHQQAFVWTSGGFSSCILILLFGWPMAFPGNTTFQRVEMGVAVYLPMLIVLPSFLLGSLLAAIYRSRLDANAE